MKKNAFTLIELLAVIVMLSIIALIATPIILNVINDAKENAFKESINGIVDSAMLESTLIIKDEELLYKYENNNWGESKLNIDGKIPRYVEVKVNKEGKVRYAITDGFYCAMKEYDNEINIKRISSENNDKKVEEQYCKLDAIIPTDASCFVYKESDNLITITSYSCYEGNKEGKPVITDLVIPEKINGKKVTSLAFGAFSSKGLTSVIIPNTITSMNIQAFYNNELTHVEIPNRITTLSENVFASNELTSIKIPDSVTRIYDGAFAANKLTNIEIPSSVIYIGPNAFGGNQMSDEKAFIYNRKNDGSIDYTYLNSYAGKNRENVIIPDNITSIGSNSFRGQSIKKIIIPEGVTTIGAFAFSLTELDSVTIPNSVTFIREWAFSFNKLTSITIPASVMKIGDNAFYNSTSYLTQVTIKGKSSISDFTLFGADVFTWKSGYSDLNIIWEGSN